VLHKFPKKLDD